MALVIGGESEKTAHLKSVNTYPGFEVEQLFSFLPSDELEEALLADNWAEHNWEDLQL